MRRWLGAAMVGLCGCANDFRGACDSIAKGELVTAAEARLERSGGTYVGKIGHEYRWDKRDRLFLTAACLVADDQPPAPETPNPYRKPRNDARVTGVTYVAGKP